MLCNGHISAPDANGPFPFFFFFFFPEHPESFPCRLWR